MKRSQYSQTFLEFIAKVPKVRYESEADVPIIA